MRTFGPTLTGLQVTDSDPGSVTVTKIITETPPDNAILTQWTITPTHPFIQ